VTGVLADDGCRLWATEVGAGGPLIVCHGGPGLWDMFGSLADSLAGEVRMIRWDQRGCGRSDRRGPYNVARSVADLDAVRAGYGLPRRGGRLAAARPQVRARRARGGRRVNK
jgi:proline iminopeptidase